MKPLLSVVPTRVLPTGREASLGWVTSHHSAWISLWLANGEPLAPNNCRLTPVGIPGPYQSSVMVLAVVRRGITPLVTAMLGVTVPE